MKTKKELKNMKNCGIKSDLARSITENWDDFDETFMKIKFNSDGELPLNKTIEISSMIIDVRPVSHENNKYYRWMSI